MNEFLFLISFLLFIGLILALDLGVFHKKDHVISFKEATAWTVTWISVALLFYVFIYFFGDLIHGISNMQELEAVNKKHHHGLLLEGLTFEDAMVSYRRALSLEYLTGYLIEKSLSIDNVFVMIMIFSAFSIDKKYYHRVLFYGILGAVVLRFIFIFTASSLIHRFEWLLLVFGAVLIYTGVKMFLNRNKKENIDSQNHPIVKFLSKRNLVTPTLHGHDFFVRYDGVIKCTPLFVVLIVIEFSDVIFAFDSIPAIFSVTQDPFIVFFSNIFAILGLRSLFFMVENVMDKFHYLKIGLSVLLVFIGVKMMLPELFDIKISTPVSLLVIVGILTVSILCSVIFKKK